MTVRDRALKSNLKQIELADFEKLKRIANNLAKDLKFYQDEEHKVSTRLWEERLKR